MSDEANQVVNTNMSNTTAISVNFQHRKERLLLKSLLTWVTMRFAGVQDRKFEGTNLYNYQQLCNLEQMKKIAIISESDAWLMEQNASLFSRIGCEFMKEFLNEELYKSYGGILFAIDRKNRVADIALIPPSRNGVLQEVTPCTMFVLEDDAIIKQYKETETLVREKYIDIVPLLSSMITTTLEPRWNRLIDRLFDKYKDDSELLDMRSRVQARREKEEETLEKVLKAINVQGSRVNLAKLAIILHTAINVSYNSGPNLITKLKYQTGGGAVPVMEFSRAFTVDFMDTLEPLAEILQPLIPNDIKIKTHENTILFTTGNLSPSSEADMNTILTANVPDEATLDHIFNNHVGPNVSIDDVAKVMNRVLFQKYKNTHF